ncbi:MAG TPA: phosphoglucosamine mutase [Leptolyngbyaceae cyanobacterium M33_DOE_097]|uniref:Phosphoglucosamine mutase n=1 Tax=Oscillatoriales cyanobacterium SpSt-418 TaxID=2282169 RepID=A0A7C3PFF4_9CYAN|nr:phosphoglucosamine mutase [Leptolyngbyaceae cyanobacterium M33_DOE_097]
MVMSVSHLEEAYSATTAFSKPNSQTGWTGLALPDSRLFGTDGIRGKAGDFLTAPLALQIGYWAGQVLRAEVGKVAPIILGQDSRNSSSMLAMALAGGLTAAGLEVWDLGLCPTPAVAYLASMSEAIGGVMISASHNPPEDNGIKFFGADGGKLSLKLQEQIEAALRGNLSQLTTYNGAYGRYCHRSELLQHYCAALQDPLKTAHQDNQPLKGLRVVLDLAWGAATQLAPMTFQALGAEVVCLHDQPDGDRINVNCGSTHLASLKTAVVQHQADLGFAFDGDADRVLAVDAQGRTVDGDYILYLWGCELQRRGELPNNTIVATVMSNLGFERAWEAQGGTLLRTAVGDQYVYAEMKNTGAVLGGEQSGHIICHHYGIGGDGLMTALHLSSLVRNAGTSLTDLLDKSFQPYPQLLQNVRVEDRARRRNWQECEALQQAIAAAEADMGDRGRVLVRASGTEPVIRVMVEAATVELVNHWTSTLVAVVEQHLA